MTITGINGSVSVVEGMKNLFKENVKVSLTVAADMHKNRLPMVRYYWSFMSNTRIPNIQISCSRHRGANCI